MKTRELIKKIVPEISDKELARIDEKMLDAEVGDYKQTWHADDSQVRIHLYLPQHEDEWRKGCHLYVINIHREINLDGVWRWFLDWID